MWVECVNLPGTALVTGLKKKVPILGHIRGQDSTKSMFSPTRLLTSQLMVHEHWRKGLKIHHSCQMASAPKCFVFWGPNGSQNRPEKSVSEASGLAGLEQKEFSDRSRTYHIFLEQGCFQDARRPGLVGGVAQHFGKNTLQDPSPSSHSCKHCKRVSYAHQRQTHTGGFSPLQFHG